MYMKKIIYKSIPLPTVALMIYLLQKNDHPIFCVFKKITGLYCPGCGITRCIASILECKFYQAFRYNPLLFVLIPFLLPYVIYKYYIYIFNKTDKITSKIPNVIWWILLIITLIFGILRNIDMFKFLAPTTI